MTNIQNDNFYLNALTQYMGLVVATKCKVEIFTGGMSGNWLCPSDVEVIYILGIGAGAGGGGGQHPQAGASARAGQAGGGSNPMFTPFKTIPGNSYAYSVPVGGIGGAGGTAAATTGVDGTDGLNATWDFIKFWGGNKGTKGSTAPTANGEVSGGTRLSKGGNGGVSGGASNIGGQGDRTIYNSTTGSLPGGAASNSWASGGGGGGGYENGGNGGDGGTVLIQNSVRLAKIKADVSGGFYSLDVSPTWQLYNYVTPGFNGDVLAVAEWTGTNPGLVVGGSFTTANGVSNRNRLVKIGYEGVLQNFFDIGAPGFATSGFNNTVRAIAIDNANGRIYVGGDFTTYNTLANRNRIICLDQNGSQVNAFNINVNPPGTPAATSGFNGVVRAIAVQSDGKVIVGGDFTTYKGVAQNRLIRINTDGSKDATFNIGTGPNGAVHTIAIQADGKIIIGGDFTSYNGTARGRVARVSNLGALDVAYATGTGLNGTVRTIYIQPDGHSVFGGDFTTYNGVASSAPRIVRLLSATGANDTGNFLPATGFNSTVWKIVASPRANKILVATAATTYSNKPCGKIQEIDLDYSYGQYGGYPNDMNIEIGTGAAVAYTVLNTAANGVYIGSNGTTVAQLNHNASGDAINGGVGAGGGGGGVAPKYSNLYFPNSGKGGNGGDGVIVIAYVTKT